MAKKKSNKEHDEMMKNVGIGVGLTTAAVAAAGAYFLYGSDNASKNRKTVKSWALKAKADVLEQLEEAKEMTQDEYEELVATVVGAYATAKKASKKDIKEFAEEMRLHWKQIEKAAAPVKRQAKKTTKQAKKTTKTAKKAAKKATKKTTKKAAKKKTK